MAPVSGKKHPLDQSEHEKKYCYYEYQHIWLSGNDGLWRYDGNTFTNFTHKFVGYIYEDKKGNIWTSSESANDQNWALSRYDEKSLSSKKPVVTEIKVNDKMLCGILEANDGSIWFGGLKGVYRYDGKTITLPAI